MRSFLPCILVLIFSLRKAPAQEARASDFLLSGNFHEKRFAALLQKNKFQRSGTRYQRDTLVEVYTNMTGKQNADPGSSILVEWLKTKSGFCFNYITGSRPDFLRTFSDLQSAGFFCTVELGSSPALFQREDVTIYSDQKITATDTAYTFNLEKKSLPDLRSIRFADDLLSFESQQELVAVFGGDNVMSDAFYFSEKELLKCSVIFPGTRRQAIFVWADQENLRQLSHVIVGDNVNTSATANYQGVIGQNAWQTTQGISPGMSLRELLSLNRRDFFFYGINSGLDLMVVPETSGALDFVKTKVVLACLNPGGSRLFEKPRVRATEIVEDNRGFMCS